MPFSFLAPARLGIAALCLASLVAPAIAAEIRSISITEPFGLAWGPDRIDEPVSFPEGAVSPQGVSLKDSAGAAVPLQLSQVELWPDGTSVKSADLPPLMEPVSINRVALPMARPCPLGEA